MSNRSPVSNNTPGANFDAQESNNFVEDACTTSNAVLLQCCGTCKASAGATVGPRQNGWLGPRRKPPSLMTHRHLYYLPDRRSCLPHPRARSSDRTNAHPRLRLLCIDCRKWFRTTRRWASGAADSPALLADITQVPSSTPQATQGASRCAMKRRHSSQYQSPSGQSFIGHMDIHLRCWTLCSLPSQTHIHSHETRYRRVRVDHGLRSCP